MRTACPANAIAHLCAHVYLRSEASDEGRAPPLPPPPPVAAAAASHACVWQTLANFGNALAVGKPLQFGSAVGKALAAGLLHIDKICNRVWPHMLLWLIYTFTLIFDQQLTVRLFFWRRCKEPALEACSLRTLAKEVGTSNRTSGQLAWTHLQTMNAIDQAKGNINACLAQK